MTALLRMNILEARQHWSSDVKKVYLQYPSAIRSSKWDEIVSLANAGEKDKALDLAASTEQTKSQHAENVMARRIRIQRVALFNLQRNAIKEIRSRFRDMAFTLAAKIEAKANGIPSISPLNDKIHEGIVALRRDLKRLITDWIWASILMGIRQMGEAIEPIFKANQESFQEELTLLSEFNAYERDLIEAGDDDTFPVKSNLAVHGSTKARLTSPKWSAITDRIYLNIAKKNLDGLTLSERIYDLTNRAEADLKRQLASDIASGASPRAAAERVKKYLYGKGDEDFEVGPGVYRSPLKNALRLTRTEIGKAYTSGTAAWAKDKSWVAGIRITLSDAHDMEDICDEYAGKLVTPEEFEELVPFHPHCMCHAVIEIKDDKLEDQEAA